MCRLITVKAAAPTCKRAAWLAHGLLCCNFATNRCSTINPFCGAQQHSQQVSMKQGSISQAANAPCSAVAWRARGARGRQRALPHQRTTAPGARQCPARRSLPPCACAPLPLWPPPSAPPTQPAPSLPPADNAPPPAQNRSIPLELRLDPQQANVTLEEVC